MKLLMLVALNVVAAFANDHHLQSFRDSNRQLSAKIYKELRQNSTDFVASPLSVGIALALVQEGAGGNTAKQLAAALSLPTDSTKLTEMIEAVLPEIQSSRSFKFNLVNKLYVRDDFTINDKFKSTAMDVFKSTVELVDMKKKDETISKINNWVAESTENNINNLVTPADINAGTVAVLLNAIYFQGTWTKRFYPESTQKQAFYPSKDVSVPVDMMEQTGSFGYFESSEINAKFLKMSYVGGDLSMVVVLPNDHDSFNGLENNIAKVFEEKNFDFKKVHVQFPKFSMDHTIKFIPVLQSLGVVDLFKPGADLSGISNKPLLITSVVQKNTIEVNEKGTIAASATAAVVGVGAGYNPELPIDFIVNRPFTYFIESPVGVVFVGRFTGTSV